MNNDIEEDYERDGNEDEFYLNAREKRDRIAHSL